MRSLWSSRLFWKFFVSILLAQVLAALAVGGTVWWRNQETQNRQFSQIENGPRAEESIQGAKAILEYGGQEALEQYLRTLQHHQVYVIRWQNGQAQELLGRKLSPEILQELMQDKSNDASKENRAQGTAQNRGNLNPASYRMQSRGEEYILFLPRNQAMRAPSNFDYNPFIRLETRPSPPNELDRKYALQNVLGNRPAPPRVEWN